MAWSGMELALLSLEMKVLLTALLTITLLAPTVWGTSISVPAPIATPPASDIDLDGEPDATDPNDLLQLDNGTEITPVDCSAADQSCKSWLDHPNHNELIELTILRYKNAPVNALDIVVLSANQTEQQALEIIRDTLLHPLDLFLAKGDPYDNVLDLFSLQRKNYKDPLNLYQYIDATANPQSKELSDAYAEYLLNEGSWIDLTLKFYSDSTKKKHLGERYDQSLIVYAGLKPVLVIDLMKRQDKLVVADITAEDSVEAVTTILKPIILELIKEESKKTALIKWLATLAPAVQDDDGEIAVEKDSGRVVSEGELLVTLSVLPPKEKEDTAKEVSTPEPSAKTVAAPATAASAGCSLIIPQPEFARDQQP